MKRNKFHDSSPGSPSGSTKQTNKRKKLTVSKKNQNKSNEKSKFLNSIPLPLTNKFAALEQEKMDDESTSNAHTASKSKIAPIVVTNFEIDIQSITAALELSEPCDIKLVSVGRKIFAKSMEDKQKITDALKETNIDYFSHPDIDQKIFKAVLTGLPEVPISDITDSLKESHNITATKVIMFNTKSTSKLYLCHFQKSEVNMKTLNAITTCYHHIIKWQPYKPTRKGPTQCYRCMLYGHGISQCMRYAVCSLCSGNHLTNSCKKITKDTVNPVYKCYNCASANLPAHNHKATDPNCPYRAKYEQTIKNARDKTKHTNTSTATSSRVNGSNNSNIIANNSNSNDNHVRSLNLPTTSSSYAEAAQTQHTNTRPQSSSTRTQQRDANVREHSTNQSNNNIWSIAEVADLLLSSINELKACQTKLDQLKIIANLLQNACI